MLRDGRCLILGGEQDFPSEPFEHTGTTEVVEAWSAAEPLWKECRPMLDARGSVAAAVLADGRLLVAGGTSPRHEGLASAELFDPGTGQWSRCAPMSARRYHHTLTALADGRALVVGGDYADARTAELWSR